MNQIPEINESEFEYSYVPPQLIERKKNWRSLSVAERFELTWQLSLAAWERLGVVYDPNQPTDKTIRRITRLRA